MAKRAIRDEVPETDIIVTTQPVNIGSGVALNAPPLREGEVYVDILDEHRRAIERIAISVGDAVFKISHAGKVLSHVGTGPDGVWGYAE